jgi:16S rRNA (adenine(1408)-N(1))-methyltransferase
MRVVRGRSVVEVGEEAFAALLGRYRRLVVDVGTGDGRFPYALAKEHPEALVVGLDLGAENLRELSHRASRRPERGGRPNVLYALAAAESPPAELAGRASEVHVTLPWGRLLEGVALGDPEVLAGLARLAAGGARLAILLNCEVWGETVPGEVHHLPAVTVEYARETLGPRFAAHGIALRDARMLTREEVARLQSTWAKRLRHGREHARFLHLEAVVGGGGARPVPA